MYKLYFFGEIFGSKSWARLIYETIILSMEFFNSQFLGTSFSPIDTVLVSRLPFVNYCVVTKLTFSCN